MLRPHNKGGAIIDIKCDCGKLIARERDGVIYVWCKECHKEVPLKIEKEPLSR